MRFLQDFILLLLLSLNIQPSRSKPFQDLNYADLVSRLLVLNGSFAHASYAKDTLGIDEIQDGDDKCSPLILRVTDRLSLSTDVNRPQVLISGEIHGDERVGPQASLFASQLLVWSALCEIKRDNAACKQLDNIEVDKAQRKWLAYLASKRDIFIVPAANCIGYMKNRREEKGVDPNRDFAYSRKDSNCLRSATARTLYKIVEMGLIQIVVTFHGGMVAIGYEWGSGNHPSPRDRSPDDNANRAIADNMRTFAGTFPGEKMYPVNAINSIVYPVQGGMEDWMYAAGWDKSQLKSCNGVPSSTVSKSAARAAVFLIETSDKKRPPDKTLGDSKQPFNNKAEENGHIPRNTRLSLMAVDVAQPYLCFDSITTSTSAQSTHTRTLLQSSDKNKKEKKRENGVERRRENRSLRGEEHSSEESVEASSEEQEQEDRSSSGVGRLLLTDTDTAKKGSSSSSTSPSTTSFSTSSTSTSTSTSIPVHEHSFDIEWYLGGAIHADATWLSWHEAAVSVDQLRSQGADYTFLLDTLQQPPLPPQSTPRQSLEVPSSSSTVTNATSSNSNNHGTGGSKNNESSSSSGNNNSNSGSNRGGGRSTSTGKRRMAWTKSQSQSHAAGGRSSSSLRSTTTAAARRTKQQQQLASASANDPDGGSGSSSSSSDGKVGIERRRRLWRGLLSEDQQQSGGRSHHHSSSSSSSSQEDRSSEVTSTAAAAAAPNMITTDATILAIHYKQQPQEGVGDLTNNILLGKHADNTDDTTNINISTPPNINAADNTASDTTTVSTSTSDTMRRLADSFPSSSSSSKNNKQPLPAAPLSKHLAAASIATSGAGRWAPGTDPLRPERFRSTIRIVTTTATKTNTAAKDATTGPGPVSRNADKLFASSLILTTTNKKKGGEDGVVVPASGTLLSATTPEATTSSKDSSSSSSSNGGGPSYTILANFANASSFSSPIIFLRPGDYWLVAWGIADQNWGQIGQGYPSESGPQTYLSNARTTPGWTAQSLKPNTDTQVLNPGITKNNENGMDINPRIVKGRKLWPSDPIVVRVAEDGSVTVVSSVLQCAWWDRSTTGGTAAANTKPPSVVPSQSSTAKNATASSSSATTSNDEKAAGEEEVDAGVKYVRGNPLHYRDPEREVDYATGQRPWGHTKFSKAATRLSALMIGSASLFLIVMLIWRRLSHHQRGGNNAAANRNGKAASRFVVEHRGI